MLLLHVQPALDKENLRHVDCFTSSFVDKSPSAPCGFLSLLYGMHQAFKMPTARTFHQRIDTQC
jgi:hypothetical protein